MGQFPDKKEISRILKILDPSSRGTDTSIEKLVTYGAEILRWNKRINLTGAKTMEQFFTGPLFDALTCIPTLARSGTLVDIGSGGGLPGIPAAILIPEMGVTLVEPRAKRASFLRHVVHLLDLEVEVIVSRDDDLGGRTWNGAVAQAVWPVGEWLPRATNVVAPGGTVHTLTADPVAQSALPHGMKLEEQRHVVRPSDQANRYSARIRFQLV
jgi:16S rRNA (guanine527-N7)-methyltransferase